MSNEELRDRLDRLHQDIQAIKTRSYCGEGTAFMVFCLWFVFLFNGCDFK